MKAIVTGATGFVGSHIADILASKGYMVTCLVRKTSNLRWLENKGYNIVPIDFHNIDELKAIVEGQDYFYHIGGATFARNEAEFMRSNCTVTKNILDAISEVNPSLKRFLFMSSQTVAGPASSLDTPATEDMPTNPLTAYGRSKKAAEDIVMSYSEKLPVSIVRAPAVYGSRDTAIYDIFKIIKYGMGTFIGFKPKYISLIEGSDLARGSIMAAESEKAINETYFITSKKIYTWDEVIPEIRKAYNSNFLIKLRLPHFAVLSIAYLSEQLGKFSKKPPVFNYDKGIDFIQKYWICSGEKAKQDFGFEQGVSLEEGVRKTVEWYKAQGWL
jgi:nucleoside-diphosphate-sugar epimerase